MTGERIWLFDTTLRDGAQTRGIDFSVADKIAIAKALDDMGIDYIEGGWPGANPTDNAFFADLPTLKSARTVAFGMTRRGGRSASNDPGLVAVMDAPTDGTCLVGKTWDFHVRTALGVELDENLEMITSSLQAVADRGRQPMFDCEHFFDGFKNNPDYALACAKAAFDGGAEWIVLCDTNGGSMPDDISAGVAAVKAHLPDANIGIHCHNDCGLAVANSIAAVQAGARQVQGTINGIGERCGNADLITLIPNLMLKYGYQTGVAKDRLPKLKSLSRLLDNRINRVPNAHAPYVGDAAFAHKGGLHASAAQKDPRTYEHVPPETVGNMREYIVSDQSGKANFLARFEDFGIAIDKNDARLDALIADVKTKEYNGWAFDTAEASMELLVRRALGEVPDYFLIGRFRVMDERRFNAKGKLVVESEATVTVTVGGESFHEAAEGNGPVNAVDTAVRKALIRAYPKLSGVTLFDYKVRIISGNAETADGEQGGTDAVTRVLIECRDDDGTGWTSVGVSTNIIDASVMALSDAMTWKLFKDGVQAPLKAPVKAPLKAPGA
ncbi:MAG: citramalate synthase [Alphaproteobacteria bacterium]|nr:citramalate synthase [Alphaproteobacteria bacterium]